MTFTIYALVDDREPEMVRYVGFSRHPAFRLREHIWEAQRSSERSHRLNWIRALLGAGVRPSWRTLATVESAEEAARLEIELIATYRANGQLVNGTEGGEGVQGFGGSLAYKRVWSAEERERRLIRIRSPETRAKMSASAKARPPSRLGKPGISPTPETRAKLSAALKGRPKTREHALKAAAWCRGRPKTPEQRAKISATKKGNSPVSPEMRAQISAKMKGVPKSPETRARMREAQRRRFAKEPAEVGASPA